MLRTGFDTGYGAFPTICSDLVTCVSGHTVFAGSSVWTSEACPVLRSGAPSPLPSTSFAPLSRTSLACVSIHAAAAIAILLLSACADKPPIISADTSCERFRHISATPAQIKVYQDNWEVMETYADQVVSHNLEYDRNCLGVAP